jgi:hypothetical protein
MPNFIPTDYKQSVLLPINFEDQLQPGTFEHAIHYLIDNVIKSMTLNPLILQLLTAHPLYLELGKSDEERQYAYRSLFRGRMSERTLIEIWDASNKGFFAVLCEMPVKYPTLN